MCIDVATTESTESTEQQNSTQASGVPWVREPKQLELNFDEEPQVA